MLAQRGTGMRFSKARLGEPQRDSWAAVTVTRRFFGLVQLTLEHAPLGRNTHTHTYTHTVGAAGWRRAGAHSHMPQSSRTSTREAPWYTDTASVGHQRASSRCQFSSSDAGATTRCGPGSPCTAFSTPARG